MLESGFQSNDHVLPALLLLKWSMWNVRLWRDTFVAFRFHWIKTFLNSLYHKSSVFHNDPGSHSCKIYPFISFSFNICLGDERLACFIQCLEAHIVRIQLHTLFFSSLLYFMTLQPQHNLAFLCSRGQQPVHLMQMMKTWIKCVWWICSLSTSTHPWMLSVLLQYFWRSKSMLSIDSSAK